MKVKKLLKFADWLESNPHEFDIANPRACISAHAAVFEAKRPDKGGETTDADFEDFVFGERHLANAFNLPEPTVRGLYYVTDDECAGGIAHISRKMAANALRYIALHGAPKRSAYSNAALIKWPKHNPVKKAAKKRGTAHRY